MKYLFSSLMVGLLFSTASGQSGERWFYNIDSNNIAIGGYDVVSYFTDNEARHGLPEYKSEYKGVTYLFSSAKNRDIFGKSPEKYLPQYGGWCSFFVGINSEKSGVPKSRVRPDPTKFLVKEGKLYLFFNSKNQDLRAVFSKSADSLMIRGNSFWESRIKLASKYNGKPEGLNPSARMELLEWLPFMGEWEAEAKWWNDTTGTNWGGTKGRWHFNFGFGGYCIQDDWWPENDGVFSGTTSGPAIRGYDPLTEEWNMTFIPVNQGRKATWLMTGKFIDESTLEGKFESTDWLGRKFIQKIIFSSLSKNEFVWRAHRSFDGGVTWKENVMVTNCVKLLGKK